MTEEDSRFSFLTKAEHEKLQEGYTPKNTEKNTKWALSNFLAWRDARVNAGKDSPPTDLLSSTNPALLSNWLSKFEAETRSIQGKPYSPSTVYQLLTGLLWCMRDINVEAANFLDKATSVSVPYTSP